MEKNKEIKENDTQRARQMAMVGAVLAAITMLAEIYVVLKLTDEKILIVGIGLIFISSVMLLIHSVMTINQHNKDMQREEFDEIFRAQKASYLMLRKNFEELSDRLYDIEESGSLPADEIISAQKAVAKVTISRSKENTDALMNSNDLLLQKFFEFEEKLSNNNNEIIRQNEKMLSDVQRNIGALNDSLNSMQHSLLAIEKNQSAFPAQPVMMVAQGAYPAGMQPYQQNPPMYQQGSGYQQPPYMNTPPQGEPSMMQQASVEPRGGDTNFMSEAPKEDKSDNEKMDLSGETTFTQESELMTEETTPPVETEPIMEQETVNEPEITGEPEIPVEPEPANQAELEAATSEPEEAPSVNESESADANKPLTADEIADIVNQAESTPKEEAPAEKPSAEPPKIEPVSDDPNKTLTPEEIAAIVAQSEPVPEEKAPAEEPPTEPPKIEPVSDDPNKQLSPDEIAAMFAQADAAPAEPEPEPKAEPPKIEPVSDDPNKQLSPDEIAAMFAQADAAPAEPAPAPKIEPVSDDPNKQLSPDEIAAMFAQVDAAPAEPAPAPAPAPVSDDPNKMMSPEEIEAMFAAMQ